MGTILIKNKVHVNIEAQNARFKLRQRLEFLRDEILLLDLLWIVVAIVIII